MRTIHLFDGHGRFQKDVDGLPTITPLCGPVYDPKLTVLSSCSVEPWWLARLVCEECANIAATSYFYLDVVDATEDAND